MIFLIGMFLLLLGVILDDGTTAILFIKNLGSLETNPIFLYLGTLGWIVAMLALYIMIIVIWYFIIETYKKVYDKKLIFWRFYDVFVFLACFILIVICFTKIELGISNIKLLHDSNNPIIKAQLLETTNKIDSMSKEEKITSLSPIYHTNDISYLKMLLYIIFSYGLFRIGYKVKPYASE